MNNSVRSENSPTHLQVQYHDALQQHESAVAGMWLFLATEVMFFGGAIAVYIVYWYMYPSIWKEFSAHLDVVLGSINTAVLLTSSLFVALGVHAGERGYMKKVMWYLASSALLGAVFLMIKGYEWYQEYLHGFYPGAWHGGGGELVDRGDLYFRLYFALTGLHALHVIIGIVLLSIIAILARLGRYSKDYYTPIEVSGLYWHFVDIVWIFLFPMLYLVDRTQ